MGDGLSGLFIKETDLTEEAVLASGGILVDSAVRTFQMGESVVTCSDNPGALLVQGGMAS